MASVTDAPCSLVTRSEASALRERGHAAVLNAAIGGVLGGVIAGLEAEAARFGTRVPDPETTGA